MVIDIPRGDTCNLHIDVVDADGNPYILAEGDVLSYTDIDGNTVTALFQRIG